MSNGATEASAALISDGRAFEFVTRQEVSGVFFFGDFEVLVSKPVHLSLDFFAHNFVFSFGRCQF